LFGPLLESDEGKTCHSVFDQCHADTIHYESNAKCKNVVT